VLLLLAVASPTAAQVGTNREVPVSLPERPFLLLDAPRRFLPSEPAEVRIQVREGGNVRLSVFRWSEPAQLLAQAGRRDGVSVAATALGARAEALVARTTPLPREEAGLTLLRHERLTMGSPERARRIASEALVYDSSEEVEDDVATYGVDTGEWASRR